MERSRYDRLMAKYDNLAEHAPEAAAALPTRVHEEVIELLDELLSLVPPAAGPLGHALTLVKRLRPVLLREFATVPPEKIIEGLHAIGSRMLAVGVEGATGDADAAAHVDIDQRDHATG